MKEQIDFIRIPVAEIESVLQRILTKHGFARDKAMTCAAIFTANSLDGVYSHGVNRFAKFIQLAKDGLIKPDREAICKNTVGNIEQWDGQLGPGPLNAMQCTDRAMEIASKNGMGCVALANTNHWMRGGAYGWRAAKQGFVFVGWSNTIANMPAWGAINGKLGNNPLVIAVPYQQEAIVLDMAMSQYSYGALEVHKMRNEKLSVPGGYDVHGKVTRDPQEILESQRALPVGYWKGAGLSLLLDMLATILSGGLSTSEISNRKSETSLSQVFIAFDISHLKSLRSVSDAIDLIVRDYQDSVQDQSAGKIRYPGENILKVRSENSIHGIPVASKVWNDIELLL
jgi:3-dehydro-L-gulonate 2-dehydrogenase